MQSLKSECVCKQHTSAVQCRFCPQPVIFAEDGRIPLADVIFDTAVHNFWSLRGWSWGLNESVGDTWGHSTVRYKNQTDHCNMLMVSKRNEKKSEVLILVRKLTSTVQTDGGPCSIRLAFGFCDTLFLGILVTNVETDRSLCCGAVL